MHVLIDRSFEQHLYRQANSIPTEFYHHGGQSRFVKARFLHACSTISNVEIKRQPPIIERQIERLDEVRKKSMKIEKYFISVLRDLHASAKRHTHPFQSHILVNI